MPKKPFVGTLMCIQHGKGTKTLLKTELIFLITLKESQLEKFCLSGI